MRKLRKWFTIVELVIVIAVIAVLAAVLIPTFLHLSKKAKEASDKSLVATLNTSLKIEEADSGKKPKTMHDAVLGLENQGYKLPQLITKSGEDLVYNIDENQFYLGSGAEELISKRNSDADPRNDLSYHDFWHIEKSVPSTQKWSIYAHQWTTAEVENLTVGFDAGYEGQTTITSIGYDRSSASDSRSVIIRTLSVLTDITINAPHDTVSHYGEVGKVTIPAIDMNCYNEYGNAKYVKVSAGKVVAKSNGSISIVFADNTNGSEVAVIKETNGNIDNGYTRVEDVDTTNRARTDGIPLTYAMYIDETTTLSGDAFVDFVESTAEYAVETAKQVEEASQAAPSLGPTGTFSDPFVVEEAYLNSCLEVDKTYYLTEEGLFDEDDNLLPYEDDLAAVIEFYGSHDIEDYEVDAESPFIVSIDYDEMTGFEITGSSVGEATIFVTFDDDDSTELSFTINIVEAAQPKEDGKNVYALNDEPQDVNTSNRYVNLTNVENGSTIKFLRDYSESIIFYAKNNKSITVDLNGCSIKDICLNDITATLIDSSTDKSGKVELLSFSCAYGVENPAFNFNAFYDDAERNDYHEGEGYHYLEMWTDRPAKLTLLGGSIKTLHLQYCGEVEIAGAIIINTDERNDTLSEGYAFDLTRSKYMNLTIKSGVVIGVTDYNDFGKVTISGGYFNEQVPTQYLASGYTCVKITEGMYRVVAK